MEINRVKGDRTGDRYGVEKNYKVGNYRISKYRIDNKSNISSVMVSCYCSATEFNSISRALLNVNRMFSTRRSLLEKNGLHRLIFVPELAETCLTHGNGFCDFTLQFKVDGELSKGMVEPCYKLAADVLIDVIEGSRLVVLNK